LRRKESQKTWAQRMGASVPTLMRLEAGEASVRVTAQARLKKASKPGPIA
jgi:hypothetical protein